MPRQPTWDREAVTAFAAAQYFLITALQLQTLWVPSSTVSRSNHFGGMFSLVLPGVHRVDGRGPLSIDQRDMATLLYAGAGSALTGRSALARMAIEAAMNDAFGTDVHVLIGHGRRRSCVGFAKVERTVYFPTVFGYGDFPVVNRVRAVADAVRSCTDKQAVRALVFEVVQRRLVSLDDLDAERRRGQIRGSRYLRLAIEENAKGPASIPEGDLCAAFERAGWSNLHYNCDLLDEAGAFLARPDVYDERTGTALEVDSRAHHFGVHDWEATMARHGRMTARGLAVLHAPPSRIAAAPATVVGEFCETVRARSGVPTPRVLMRCRPQCSAGLPK